MTRVLIQKAQEMGSADYERVARAVGVGTEAVDTGPPPQVSFEVKHIVRPWRPKKETG